MFHGHLEKILNNESKPKVKRGSSFIYLGNRFLYTASAILTFFKTVEKLVCVQRILIHTANYKYQLNILSGFLSVGKLSEMKI